MRPAGPARALIAFIVAGLAVVVAAILVPSGPSPADRLDEGFRAALPGWLGIGLEALNLLGSLPVWVAIVVLVAVPVWRRRGLAAEVVAVAIGTEALTTVVRILVNRPRPPFGLNTELLVAAGFPSGHVTRTVVLTASLLVVLTFARRHRPAWLGLSTGLVMLMCLARVAASAHYASDTLGGVALGAAVVALWAFVRDPERAVVPAAAASAEVTRS
jgi:membrane-associated phospholipid phosphatase